jgi:hypothetical protein
MAARSPLALVAFATFAAFVVACAESPLQPGALTPAGCPLPNIVGSAGGASAAGLEECPVRDTISPPVDTVVDLGEGAEILGGIRTTDGGGGVAQQRLGNAAEAIRWVVWSRAGQRALASPAGVTSFTVVDLNNRGEVLGYTGAGAAVRIIVWDAAGVPRLLDAAASFVPASMNDAGIIVGGDRVRLADGAVLPIVPAGAGSDRHSGLRAVHVSNAGLVTGTMTNFTAPSSFTWSRTAGYREVDAVGRNNGTIRGVNEQGWAVATDTETPDPTRGVRVHLWTGAGRAQITGMVDASGLNDVGEVLGVAVVDGARRVVTWSPTGGLREIMRRTDAAATAIRINSWGDILGTLGGKPIVWAHGTARYR